MTQGKIEALLSLRGAAKSPIGRERIDLLEAVSIHGSITKAAKAVDLSYKAAWDAINAVNNLLPRPVVIGQTGGRQGGGAVVTEDGHRLIKLFRQVEEKLARIAGAMAPSEDGSSSDLLGLFWSVAMKTSARNAFMCEVLEVNRAAVNVEVTMRVTDTNVITAVITNYSATDLGIEARKEVMALIKSSFIMLARADDMPRVSARNRISGVVVERHDGGVNSEVTLDIGGGKTLTAVITRESADTLPLLVGDRACALFKASHVILAVD